MPSGAPLLFTAFTDSLFDEQQFFITLVDTEGDVVCHTDAMDPELVNHNGVFSSAIDGPCEFHLRLASLLLVLARFCRSEALNHQLI